MTRGEGNKKRSIPVVQCIACSFATRCTKEFQGDVDGIKHHVGLKFLQSGEPQWNRNVKHFQHAEAYERMVTQQALGVFLLRSGPFIS
jgi:hypothetical protein